jgi:hypothetical protein
MAEPQTSTITQNLSNGVEKVGDSLGNIRDNVSNTLKGFSSNVSNYSSQEFMNSNSIIAKFVFLILILIGFLIFMNLGISLITYSMQPTTSPYVFSGLLSGNNYQIVYQDPKKVGSVTILRSNNAKNGIEFTWSIWLNVQDYYRSNPSIFQHIFSKGGNGVFDSNGIMQVNNAPGLYLIPSAPSGNDNRINILPNSYEGNVQMNARIYMNTASSKPTSDINSVTEYLDIVNIPMKAWFNLAIRVENKIMDVYINGVITQRIIFQNVPLQNYGDVYLCGNNGFNGQLSDLRYFNRALNVFEINNIITAGPNLSTNVSSGVSNMAFQWYNTNGGMYQ